MKVKNRKGSTLILTLIIFLVLMIFATFVLGFMVTENKQSIRHQNKMQSYYIARGGAEAVGAAILGMDEDGIEELEDKLDNGLVDIGQLDIGANKAYVTLSKDGENILIESIGYENEISEKVSKVMAKVAVYNETVEIEHAIFAGGDIKISNGTINGDIGTNGNIKIEGNPTINGDAFMAIGTTFTGPDWWLRDKWSHAREKIRSSEITYPLPGFVDFPSFPLNESIKDFTLAGSSSKTIVSSDSYRNLTIKDNTKFYIDASYKDIILNIKNFDLTNGHIIILGNNKVIFYVNNMNIGSGSTINYNDGQLGNPNKFDLFHNGTNELKIAGSQKIFGNLHIEKANLIITEGGSINGNLYVKNGNTEISGGSAVLNGNLYVNSGDITFSGSGKIDGSIISSAIDKRITMGSNGRPLTVKGVIYAPKSDINFTNNSPLEGGIVGKSVTISGNSDIKYNSKYIDASLINIETTPSSSINYISGYYK